MRLRISRENVLFVNFFPRGLVQTIFVFFLSFLPKAFKQALVTDFPVGHVNDPFLAQWQRQRLAEIAATPNEALKRALLWRYLADILLMGKTEQLILIHYEKLVTQPLKVLKSIQRQIPDAPPLYNTNKIIPSTVRQKREVLDKTDLQAIGDICGECAVALGYDESDFTEG